MLGLNVLKSPADLYNDLMNIGWLEDHQKLIVDPEYQKGYEWLKSKIEPTKCSKICEDIYSTI